jgi:hypothetical protein
LCSDAVIGGELRPSDEIKSFAWLTPDELPRRMNEGFAIRALDAFDLVVLQVRVEWNAT